MQTGGSDRPDTLSLILDGTHGKAAVSTQITTCCHMQVLFQANRRCIRGTGPGSRPPPGTKRLLCLIQTTAALEEERYIQSSTLAV